MGGARSARALCRERRGFASGAPTASSSEGQGAGLEAPGTPSGPLRAYPSEPRVGVGAVVLRQRPSGAADRVAGRAATALASPLPPVDVLLIVRGKPPSEGLWSFPGGSLELGETIAACASREVLEETGVEILVDGRGAAGGARGTAVAAPIGDAGAGGEAAEAGLPGAEPARGSGPGSPSTPLLVPTPFTTRDVIEHDAQGRLWFHYVIVNVAASAVDAGAAPVPGDDARDARWVAVEDLEAMRHECIDDLVEISREAAERFLPVHPRGAERRASA